MAKRSQRQAPGPDPSHHQHFFVSWLSVTCDLLALDARRIHSELELAACVQRGFPARTIEALVEHGIPDDEIFRSVISRRTFHRRQAQNEKLTTEESDRAERFGRMLALATLVLGDEERAARWLRQPKQRLNNRAPVEMLASGIGARVVEELLLQSYFGLAA